jgi:hypothetical protein
MALGLQALGPLGLWESLAGSVLFPGYDRFCFSTHYSRMQFRRHESTHAGSSHSLHCRIQHHTDQTLVIPASSALELCGPG